MAEEERGEKSEVNRHLCSVKDTELPKAASLDFSIHNFHVVAMESTQLGRLLPGPYKGCGESPGYITSTKQSRIYNLVS